MPDACRSYRRLTWLAMATNALGLASAIALVATGRVDATGLAIFAIFFALTAIGVEVGLHRHFAHRSFEASAGARAFLAVTGAMAMQGPVMFWTTVHRRHHRFSDGPGDPHSPQTGGGLIRRLWWAHVGWQFALESVPPATIDHLRYSRDLLRERRLQRIDALYLVWVALGLALPALIGWVATGTLQGALLGFLWGGPIRIFAVDQITWGLNSVCHAFGSRPFSSGDRSTNVWWHALLSFGAGWHNNHHAFPGSARTGFGRFQIDTGYAVIRVLAALGAVRKVYVPDPEVIRSRRSLDRAA